MIAHRKAPQLDPARLPKHVAIIMDGNRRWAKARRLPIVEGHRRGIIALREVTRAASDLGIPILTVYGFSTENWKRDAKEISLLLELCVYFCENELSELSRNNVRVQVIGRHQELPQPAFAALERLVQKTASNDGLLLNLAVNYSARSELDAAIRQIAEDAKSGALDPQTLDESVIKR
ncbi:MAG: di-trans,poly-cis-decaprenylcistransferase, partial [Candidatus Eremiobacteraeota bacterium]|nr:di-trans,poly-cis-decaprenylcistransferase [Candidatus Eremiobacteraeota bacterium]